MKDVFLGFLTKSDFRNTNTEDILQSETCCGLKVKMSLLAEILGENLHSRGKQKLPLIAVIANSKNRKNDQFSHKNLCEKTI